MKERPILFSAPMVRALLDGSKTQTRRICKPALTLTEVVGIQDPREFGQCPLHIWNSGWFGDAEGDVQFESPYGKPGDRLWVRETFYAFGRWVTQFNTKKGRDEWHFIDMTLECGHAYRYVADGNHPVPMLSKRGAGVTPGWSKRPAIFMPRVASRLVREITAVRVDRLQDISADDCYAEGAAEWAAENAERLLGDGGKYRNIIQAYKGLWESINGPGSWERNEWVWVVEFKVVKP